MTLIASIDNAKVCYLIACIVLVACGIVAVVQKSTLAGIAWIATAVAVLGLWFSITP